MEVESRCLAFFVLIIQSLWFTNVKHRCLRSVVRLWWEYRIDNTVQDVGIGNTIFLAVTEFKLAMVI